MPLSAELKARLRAYAKAQNRTMDDALALLLDAGLRAHARATKAGHARGAQVTPEAARAAVQARWAKRQG